MKNPFLKEDKPLPTSAAPYFGQKRQIGVPMVVNEFRDGEFKTLFVGSVGRRAHARILLSPPDSIGGPGWPATAVRVRPPWMPRSSRGMAT